MSQRGREASLLAGNAHRPVTGGAREIYFSSQLVAALGGTMQLATEIEAEAVKLIRRHERYAKDLSDEFQATESAHG